MMKLTYDKFLNGWKGGNIYLDSCYSGKNIYRVKNYFNQNIKYKAYRFTVLTSSGPNWTSVVTSFRSLLIASLWFEKYKGAENLKAELKKKFEFRQPLAYSFARLRLAC